MAFITGGKHFGQYTYEHWFDDEYDKAIEHTEDRMKVVLKNFRIIDEESDFSGSVIIENGIIKEILPGQESSRETDAAIIIDGLSYTHQDTHQDTHSNTHPVLMPAFVDLHAHFRDPVLYEKDTKLLSEAPLPSEYIESASMAAAAGGFGTVICMANTRPATDTIEKAKAVKNISDALGIIDLYPVISLTKGMEGKELSEISAIKSMHEREKEGKPRNNGSFCVPLMLSEDGKDLANDDLFFSAMKEAKRIGIPISCHCDLWGDENKAVRRVIELGKKAGCHIHIAHVSAKETVETIRQIKSEAKSGVRAEPPADGSSGDFILTCEVMPHNLCLTEEDAKKLGAESWGRVNPPLRSEEDRAALIRALEDGTIDAIATDHAPHTTAQKEAGAPGFSGLETAFAAVYTELIRNNPEQTKFDLKRLSSLMSANPARLLGLGSGPVKRGRILPGYLADFVIIDTDAQWIVNTSTFKSRGKNSAFKGRLLYGKVLMTIHGGRVVFEG